jgi:hypothetical protein
VEDGTLTVTRRSVEAGPPPELTVTAPDGTVTRRTAQAEGGGRAVLALPAGQPGVWQASDGRRTAFAAASAANPLEIADLRADPARLAPVTAATAGGVRWLGNAATAEVPELRRVAAGRDMAGGSGHGWLGLRRNQDHVVTGIDALPLLPPWLALPLVLGVALLAWRREGR